MRKRITVMVYCGLVFLGGWAFGQANAGGNNGARWKTLTTFQKDLYTLGFSRGYEQGLIEGIGTGVAKMIQESAPPVVTPEQKEDAFKLAAQAREHAFFRKEFKVSQVTAAVDTFYGDYRNMATCWNDAVLLSSVSLAGRTPTEESIEVARKSGAESGCK